MWEQPLTLTVMSTTSEPALEPRLPGGFRSEGNASGTSWSSTGVVYAVDEKGSLLRIYNTEAGDPFPVALGDLDKDGGNLQVVANPSRILALDIFDYGAEVKWSVEPGYNLTTPPSLIHRNFNMASRCGAVMFGVRGEY